MQVRLRCKYISECSDPLDVDLIIHVNLTLKLTSEAIGQPVAHVLVCKLHNFTLFKNIFYK
jgi:hypothetical protein